MRILLFPWLFFIPFLTVLFGNDIVLGTGQCQSDQELLLLQLNNSLRFESSSVKLMNWSRNTDCCSWDGVDCDAGGRVIGLDLSGESISDSIDNSSILFSLAYLESLNLAFNWFNSTPIPNGFDKLSKLKYLNLSNAGFAGQIPIEISRLTRLVSLDLSTPYALGNRSLKLEDPNLKMLVQNLSKLTKLYLDGVKISAQGDEWWQALSYSLPNLQVLSLSNCNLSGQIDSSLLKLQSLQVIRLDSNKWSTQVPEFFANFSNLASLRLGNSGLYGTLPGQIFQSRTLQTLDLSGNKQLNGTLPDFPQDGSLQTLVLRDTSISGPIPESMGNLKMLSRIDLANCSFSGQIPKSMANLIQLVYLDFSSNEFTGSIPSFGMSKNLTQIILSNNNLTGPIPSQWGGLPNLVNLDVRNNALSGSIPLSLFSLPALQKMQLSHNQFSGYVDFPNVSSHMLDTLDLSSNKLEGPIPMSVFKLQGLKILTLSSNNFSGSFQLSVIQQLKNLSSLDLSYNSLSVNATATNYAMSTFPQITTLKLASCNLTTFPDLLRNQSILNYLDLSNNRIHGAIPSWIWEIKNLLHLNLSRNFLVNAEESLQDPISPLSVLDLHHNQLQGKIPILPRYATYLDYSSNNFSSDIPADIGSYLTVTFFFSLSSNYFHGSIPESICSASYLQVLDLSDNSLNGVIPACLNPMMSTTLGVLNLRRNNLIGNISDTFQSYCNLRTLDLNGNHFEGKVPKSLANCSKLEVLDFGNNQIKDKFPCHLKSISSLRVLVLRSNKFYGNIDCSENNGTWQMLQIVDLASNKLSGNLPSKCLATWKAMMGDDNEVHNHIQFEVLQLNRFYYQDAITVTFKGLEIELVKILTVFTSIDLSCNNLEGPIPEEMGEFKALYVLNLSHNALTGQIPSSLGNLGQLESLDLSKNELSGVIPPELARLNFLSVLNLSNNKLVGSIPRGSQFQTFSEASFEGNEGLCGAPLTKMCTDSGESPPADSRNQQRDEFDWRFIFTGLGFGIGAGAVVAPLMFSKELNKLYDDGIDKFLGVVLPMVGLVYKSWDDWNIETDENIEGENTDDSEDDIDHGDENEDEDFRGRYCVFCSKLDITRKMVIHDPKCTCQQSPPISSYSSFSTSSSS